MGKWKSQGQTGLDTGFLWIHTQIHSRCLSISAHSHLYLHTFLTWTKAAIIVLSFNSTPGTAHTYVQASQNIDATQESNDWTWGCFGIPSREMGDRGQRGNHSEMSPQIVSTVKFFPCQNSCFFNCCFCAWWYLKELLILEGATASSECTHVIFGFTLVICLCCDFSKCTCLVRRYQKYLKHMIVEEFLLPEIFSWTFVVNCKYLLHWL